MKKCYESYIITETDISNKKFGPISITDIEKKTDITDIDIHIGKPIPKPSSKATPTAYKLREVRSK